MTAPSLLAENTKSHMILLALYRAWIHQADCFGLHTYQEIKIHTKSLGLGVRPFQVVRHKSSKFIDETWEDLGE